MVPEIWSMTDGIFCHSGPFFGLLPPPPPRNNPKNKNSNYGTFQKNEKNT